MMWFASHMLSMLHQEDTFWLLSAVRYTGGSSSGLMKPHAADDIRISKRTKVLKVRIDRAVK